MLWCCVSLQRACSEDDDHQLGEQKHEVVVEKLAIKSIPLLPNQRLSPSPRSSDLKWLIPRHSSKASQSTQTSLSMQHLQLLNIPNYEMSPLSGFTKVERIQEATNVATVYTPCGEGIRVMDCTLLFTNISPQEESQHTPFILDPTFEGISNPNVHKNILISSHSETIYKPTSDTSSESNCNDSESNSDKTLQIEKASSGFIDKKTKFVNEDVPVSPSLTKMTSTKNIEPNGENITSNFFPSSETLICIEELEDQTSIAEDQNLAGNIQQVCEEVPSEFCNKNKLSLKHLASDSKHSSHCFLTTHKSQNECSKSTDEASVSEKPVTISNSADLEVQNLIDTQGALSPRRKIPLSVSNTDILEAFDNPTAIKTEYQQKETKFCVNTLSAPSVIAETHKTVPEETFQHIIANDTEPNEDKNLEPDLTHSTEKLKAETEKIMPHSVKDITSTNNKLDEKYSNTNTKSTEELKVDTEKENEQTIMPHFVEDLAPSEGKKIEKCSNENTKSTEELKVNKDNEETIIPLTIKDVTSTERNEKQSDKNTKSIVTCMFSVNDRHPAYIHSTFNNSATKNERLPLEPMPTFIGFNRGENMLKRKVFTPEHLSLFLATCIKNDWQTPASKFVHSTSCKTTKLSTFSEKNKPLQTKQIASKQHTLENESKVLKQAQQNTSTNHNYKKKFENHLQFCSNIATYLGSSKVETYKVKRKYKEKTPKTFVVKNTFGDSCTKEITIADEVNGKTHLEESKCSQTTICTLNGQKTDPHNTNEDEKYTKPISISSSEMLSHNCVTNTLQIYEGSSKCAKKLNLSKEALQSWSKQKCASSRKGSQNMLDCHSLLKSNSEPSNSAQKFAFKGENMNTKNFERSTAENAEVLPKEYNPMYLRNSDTNTQNVLEAANNYEFSAQKCLYNNCKDVCNRNQNASDACPCSSNIIPNKTPTKCDKILMKNHHLRSCISPIQTENLEEIKIVKKRTGYKETKKFSYSDNERQQSDNNILSSCTPKSDSHITDVLPLSASSSYDDHSYHGRSYVPSSNPSQSSLLTIEETEEPTMCWTIIIKHVNPDQLYE